VLSLIQVLALDEYTRRTKDGIEKELQSSPTSASDWFTLAQEHREFFRVNLKSRSPLSLVARYVLPHEEEEHRPPLPSDFVSTLLNTAINLHDRQVQAKEWWKPWISFAAGILAAIIGAAVPLITLWLNGWCSK
jgi:hypothetical protein